MNRIDLLKALEKVRPGLSKNEVIEQATSFAFMGNRVVTYNDEISISQPVEGLDITGAVKAEELFSLLNKIKKDEIDLDPTDTEIIITCGKVRAGLVFQREISLPVEEVGEIGTWKKLPEGFMEALSFVLPTASRNFSAPAFTAVHIRKDGVIEASDGYRITRKELKKTGVDDCLIPAYVVRDLVKYPITHQAPGTGWRHFKTEEGTVFSCRILEEQYPDIDGKGLMTVEGPELVWPESLGDALDRARIFDDEEVTVTVKNKKVLVEGKSDTGWVKESVTMDYAGEEISFFINPQFLRGILSQSPSCVVGDKSLKFQGKDWTHIVYMRVKS
jgi:DNA polymerase III sliding clamp (beta) subunit (PCNA family)